jgi:hypothetical protein
MSMNSLQLIRTTTRRLGYAGECPSEPAWVPVLCHTQYTATGKHTGRLMLLPTYKDANRTPARLTVTSLFTGGRSTVLSLLALPKTPSMTTRQQFSAGSTRNSPADINTCSTSWCVVQGSGWGAVPKTQRPDHSCQAQIKITTMDANQGAEPRSEY